MKSKSLQEKYGFGKEQELSIDQALNIVHKEADKTEAELRFGVQVNTWSVNELADAVHGTKDGDVDALVAEYLDTYAARLERELLR